MADEESQKAFEAWMHIMKERQKQLGASLQKQQDEHEKVNLSDISFTLGPVLTEEQFNEYKTAMNQSPHVIKKNL
jgi:hemolysin-activating ACP:hemolysin acyltransferase